MTVALGHQYGALHGRWDPISYMGCELFQSAALQGSKRQNCRWISIYWKLFRLSILLYTTPGSQEASATPKMLCTNF